MKVLSISQIEEVIIEITTKEMIKCVSCRINNFGLGGEKGFRPINCGNHVIGKISTYI